MSVVPVIGRVQAPQPASAWSERLWTAVSVGRFAAMWIAREVRVRRDARRLAEFSDYMLHDIGISRADIEGAVRRGRDESRLPLKER